MDDVEVTCYSGHTYAERPERVRWQGVDYRIVRVDRSWHEPGGKGFQVSTRDNKRFRLCYNGANGQWSVTALGRS